MTPIPDPPPEPQPGECCGGGCCPCVYDYHHIALDKWKVRVRELGHDPAELLSGNGTQAR